MKEDRLLERILEVSRHMAEIRALTPLLSYVTDEALKLVGAERGFVVLVEPDGTLDFRVMRHQDGRDLSKGRDQISFSLLQRVISSGQPLVLSDAMNDSNFSVIESVISLRLRSIMCVPLMSRGDTLGAIYVENRSISNQFSEDDLPPLTVFANQAAVAIENAALNESLEAQVDARTQQLRQAMEQVEKGWSEAIESNSLRTVWIVNTTHDLRSSLGIVTTSLSMLIDGFFGDINDDQRRWLSKSYEATEHTLGLINNLYDFFKLKSGRITLSREMVDLQEFLEKTYEVASGLPWFPGVVLNLDIDGRLPEMAIDPLRVRQVLLNLLSNAQKFTTHGSVTIHARFSEADRLVVLDVTDTGDGIAVEKFDQLFKRFQQVDDNQQRRRLGTGLGLAICRQLVDMHGGRIWVESQLGVGSKFAFTLPLLEPRSDENLDGDSQLAA